MTPAFPCERGGGSAAPARTGGGDRDPFRQGIVVEPFFEGRPAFCCNPESARASRWRVCHQGRRDHREHFLYDLIALDPVAEHTLSVSGAISIGPSMISATPLTRGGNCRTAKAIFELVPPERRRHPKP